MTKNNQLTPASGRKSMRYLMRSIAFVSIGMASGFAPLSVHAQNLSDAMVQAYEHSGLLEQNRANLRAVDEGVASAVAAMRPQISYSASRQIIDSEVISSSTRTDAVSFAAEMELYTFGRNKLALDAAKETVLATRHSLVNDEQGVLLSAVNAYQNVREAKAVVNLRQNGLRLSERNLKAAESRFELGDITQTSLSQVKAQLAGTQAQLSAAQAQLSVAREEYRVVTGVYPERLRVVPRADLPTKGVEGAVGIAKKTHPAIRALQHRVSAADLAVQIAKKGRLPSVSLNATQSFDLNGDAGDRRAVTLDLSGPIYAGGALSSATRRAIALKDVSRAELLQSVRDVEQSVRTQWALLEVDAQAEKAGQSLVDAQRLAYEGVKEEAELGAATLLDVLDAEQDLLDAQVAAIQSRIQKQSRQYAVLSTMGLLTVEHLKLQATVYDPVAHYNTVKNAPLRTRSAQGDKLDRVLQSLGLE